MKEYNGQKLYPLTPSQGTICFMFTCSLHKQVTNIPMSLTIDKKLDFKLLQKAFEKEYERNDCFKIRFLKKDKKYFQYFNDEATAPVIQVKEFASEDDQLSFLDKDASKMLHFLKGETFRIYFIKDFNGKYGVYINACHLIMDAVAVSVFFKDLFDVYFALENNAEMPAELGSFKDYLPKIQNYLGSARYEKDKEFYKKFHATGGEPFYAGLAGPGLLEKQRIKKKNPDLRIPSVLDPIHDKADLLHLYATPDETNKILKFCEENKISPEVLLEVGFKIHASNLNYRTNDTMMVIMCSLRGTKTEKNMGGCLQQPMQRRTTLATEDMSFKGFLDHATEVRSNLFKHSTFPYGQTLAIEREMYNLSAAQAPSFMMYTWLPIEHMIDCLGDDVKVDFRGYNIGRYIFPLYSFSFRSFDRKRLEFYYMHRTSMLTKEQVIALHDNALKAIMMGIENPKITLGEIYNKLAK